MQYFETGDPTLDYVRQTRADLVIVNVYLKGKLGVEVTEEIKADKTLEHTRVILIGALFRANRFRANPTNLYGADEYIEEQIPHLSQHLCESIDELLDRSDVIVVGNADPAFAEAVTRARPDQLVIDLVRLPLDFSRVRAGYDGICW